MGVAAFISVVTRSAAPFGPAFGLWALLAPRPRRRELDGLPYLP
jgi:hypothetical protein